MTDQNTKPAGPEENTEFAARAEKAAPLIAAFGLLQFMQQETHPKLRSAILQSAFGTLVHALPRLVPTHVSASLLVISEYVKHQGDMEGALDCLKKQMADIGIDAASVEIEKLPPELRDKLTSILERGGSTQH